MFPSFASIPYLLVLARLVCNCVGGKNLREEEAQIDFLEKRIDQMNEVLEPMTHFILPGGHTVVSFCHIARCVCRRAERKTVELAENEIINDYILVYLNRLSDYLFVLARKLTKDYQVKEIPWKGQ